MEGVQIRPHLDSNGSDLAIEHVQDVAPILEWNKRARVDEQHSEWGRHVARISQRHLRQMAQRGARQGQYLVAAVHA